ncbi:MAG: hypothetical protein ACFFCS_28790 [Candidatus Hodarchaeota archaeon]
MKGSIGLGLLLGILAMIFVPYVFMYITFPLPFAILSDTMTRLGGGEAVFALSDLFSTSFGVLTDETASDALALFYNPNILIMLSDPAVEFNFLIFLPPMLSWIVGGLLAGLLTQSVKKGVISALVFVVVEILLYMLFGVLANKTMDQILYLSGSMISGDGFVGGFLGQIVITPVGFGIVGGVIGGAISKAAFGPEQI